MIKRKMTIILGIIGMTTLIGCAKTPIASSESYSSKESIEDTTISETATEVPVKTEEPSTVADIPTITDIAEMEAVLGNLTEEDTSFCFYGIGADESEGIFTVFTYNNFEYGVVVINNAFGSDDVKEIKIAGAIEKDTNTDPNSILTTKTYTIADIYTGEEIIVSHPGDIIGNLEISGTNSHYAIEYRKIPDKTVIDFLHNLINGQRNLK